MQLFRRHEVKHILLKRKRGENPPLRLSRINAYLCLRPKVQKNGSSNQGAKVHNFRDEATGLQQ